MLSAPIIKLRALCAVFSSPASMASCRARYDDPLILIRGVISLASFVVGRTNSARHLLPRYDRCGKLNQSIAASSTRNRWSFRCFTTRLYANQKTLQISVAHRFPPPMRISLNLWVPDPPRSPGRVGGSELSTRAPTPTRVPKTRSAPLIPHPRLFTLALR